MFVIESEIGCAGHERDDRGSVRRADALTVPRLDTDAGYCAENLKLMSGQSDRGRHYQNVFVQTGGRSGVAFVVGM